MLIFVLLTSIDVIILAHLLKFFLWASLMNFVRALTHAVSESRCHRSGTFIQALFQASNSRLQIKALRRCIVHPVDSESLASFRLATIGRLVLLTDIHINPCIHTRPQLGKHTFIIGRLVCIGLFKLFLGQGEYCTFYEI
jgi:hypothetical protein